MTAEPADVDLVLDFKNIIDNWQNISKYSEMLLEITKDTVNNAYKFIIISLHNGIIEEKDYWIPEQYRSGVRHLERYLASRPT